MEKHYLVVKPVNCIVHPVLYLIVVVDWIELPLSGLCNDLRLIGLIVDHPCVFSMKLLLVSIKDNLDNVLFGGEVLHPMLR